MDKNPLTAGLRPVHPGEVLREDVIPALGRSKVDIARLLGVSRPTLYALLDEKQPVTPQMAVRLGKLLGTTPESWLRMQQNYDLAKMPDVARELAPAVEAIPTLEPA
jgi:addiction module HigA family antidote